MGYPWSAGQPLSAADLNAAIANAGVGASINAAAYGFSPTASAANNRDYLAAAVAAAIKQGLARIVIPAGAYNLDTTAGELLIAAQGVEITGAGSSATVIFYAGTNNLFHFSPPVGQTYGGYGGVSDLHIYRSDNPAAGSAVLADHTNRLFVNRVNIDGAYTAIDIVSSLATHVTECNLSGDNAASGATLMRVRRAASSLHSSETFIRGVNARSNSYPGTYSCAFRVSDSDGLTISDSHLGFTGGSAFFICPINTDDQVTGIRGTNIDIDSATANGLHFATIGGATGSSGFHMFANCNAQVIGANGVLAEDAGLTGLALCNFTCLSTQGDGLNITAGSEISIIQPNVQSANLANNGSVAVQIGGTAAHVQVMGATCWLGAANTIPYFIVVTGSADYVTVGSGNYFGAAIANISNASSGTHNAIVGETVSASIASGSAVSLISGTAANVTFLSLSPGLWDVSGNVVTAPAGGTTTTWLAAAINTTSAALPTPPNNGAYSVTGAAPTAGSVLAASTGTIRLSLSATTAVYLIADANFSGGTMGAYGAISARRALQ